MKKIYLLTAALLAGAFTVNAQVTWDNFEDERRANYGFINGVFIPYNENPDQTGANTSAVAAEYRRNAAEQFDVIVMNGVMDNVTDYATGAKTMSIDVWSPAVGKTVQITLENTALAENPYPTGRHSEYQATTTVANEWETLTFTLTGTPDGTVAPTILNQLVLLFDPGTNNDDTYYFDNLNGPELANDPCPEVGTDPNMLNDFECNQNVNFLFSHSGINFRRVVNPDQSGNESSHVAQYVRNGGEEFDVIIGSFPGGPLSLQSNSEIYLDVWDPNAPTTVLVSLQNDNGDVILEMSAETSVSNQWETLTYDPSEVFEATDITQFVILFDPETNNADQYYFDNFELGFTTNVNDLDAVASFSAFPNPSFGETTFSYELKTASDIQLSIFDMTGKLIDQKYLGTQPAGTNQYLWNASGLSDGIYFYTFNVNGQYASGKIILNK